MTEWLAKVWSNRTTGSGNAPLERDASLLTRSSAQVDGLMQVGDEHRIDLVGGEVDSIRSIQTLAQI
jgi:hypothetical protein